MSTSSNLENATKKSALGLSNGVSLAFQLIAAAEDGTLKLSAGSQLSPNFTNFELKLKLAKLKLKLKLNFKSKYV
eukprot:CAMPEP_0171759268 /NCGR_PEP_ID=MMETSP0991-20121206/46777_1 /TAXON_ID=483369 /ORGANISM="non described non described, Strain CCMP2098" /LENGTH=74 /DNA_ID=CAMNT_0012362143 /DNA_START=942 /DNA_END=1168 /DNA_ORIENTATION=-